MTTLANAESMIELKSLYRKLASIHHPDKGGNSTIMQKINNQYQTMQKKIRQAANEYNNSNWVEKASTDNFSDIKIGTIVFVNGTVCEVIQVNSNTFHAVATSHNRQAVFCKTTGYGKYNRKIKASFSQQRTK
ncbi:MAG: DnaJ-class molecular chaperone [Oceanicoccus sp.]|jgi:DnaJ-class molecular chaperone